MKNFSPREYILQAIIDDYDLLKRKFNGKVLINGIEFHRCVFFKDLYEDIIYFEANQTPRFKINFLDDELIVTYLNSYHNLVEIYKTTYDVIYNDSVNSSNDEVTTTVVDIFETIIKHSLLRYFNNAKNRIGK